MTRPAKSNLPFHRGNPSIVKVSFAQTLEQERERLLRLVADCLAQREEFSPEMLLPLVGKLRQTIDDVLRRQTELFSKEELIALQSALHRTIDEQVQQSSHRFYERRFRELTKKALHDSLTGLLNRAAFDARLNEEFLRARRHARQLALVMFDVDGFKSVNDRFGHPAGDRVLIGVARALQSSFRQSDGVFRYGGDEFVAVCPETSGAAIENVLLRLHTRLQTIDGEISVSLSSGIADLTAEIASPDQLMQRADEQLYECKKLRRRRQAAAR